MKLFSYDGTMPDSLNWAQGTLVLTKMEVVPPIPEPATLFLLGSGLVGMVVNKKRKKV